MAETDASRNVVARFEYEPYGRRLNGGNDDKPGYTGHVMDAVTGLVQMQQRYYDPGIGAFLSVDPVAVNTTSGWNFCRYCYAANNPYKFTDPDGREVVIVGSQEYRDQVQKEIDTLRSKPAGRNLYDRLVRSKHTHRIQAPDREKGERNSAQAQEKEASSNGEGTGSTIRFDPSDNSQKPAFVSLGHEVGHGVAIDQGTQSYDPGSGEPGTTPPMEIQSMEAENAVRSEHGLPERPSYHREDVEPRR